jgi:hypothetical protein
MARAERLETTVRLVHAAADGRSYSVHARLDAVLDDGRRVVLLDDRGWSTSGPPGTWDRVRAAELEETARFVVVVDGDRLARLPHDVALDERLLAHLRR